MAAIMYGTKYGKFSNAAGDSAGLQISSVFHEPKYTNDEWANHVYVQLPGTKDPAFSVGALVTVQTPTDKFTGRIWYVYQGSTAYNLYVNPSSKLASEIKDASSGTIWLASALTSGTAPVVTTPDTGNVVADPGKTVLQTIADNQETAATLTANNNISPQVGPATTSNMMKYGKYAGLGLLVLALAGVIIWKLKKGKK